MKKLSILILSTFLVFSVGCQKDDDDQDTSGLNPTDTQNGFAINYTATWCGPCGDWGGPKINKYGNDAPDGAVITAHASGDPMHVAALYSSFTSDRETGGGIPSFWVADSKTSGDNDMANFLSANPTAIAGVDYEYSVASNIMTIKTNTKFFSAGSGDYNLSVLILEDGIGGSSSAGSYKQNGTTNSYPNDDYKHNFVLRASATTSAYGEMIAQNPAADSEFDKEYKISVDASWNNPYPVCIIWKVDPAGSPQFKFINSLKKKN